MIRSSGVPNNAEPWEWIMTSRKFDELASNIDDASTVVEELKDAPETNTGEKLDELQDTLKQATETIDEISDRNKKDHPAK